MLQIQHAVKTKEIFTPLVLSSQFWQANATTAIWAWPWWRSTASHPLVPQRLTYVHGIADIDDQIIGLANERQTISDVMLTEHASLAATKGPS